MNAALDLLRHCTPGNILDERVPHTLRIERVNEYMRFNSFLAVAGGYCAFDTPSFILAPTVRCTAN